LATSGQERERERQQRERESFSCQWHNWSHNGPLLELLNIDDARLVSIKFDRLLEWATVLSTAPPVLQQLGLSHAWDEPNWRREPVWRTICLRKQITKHTHTHTGRPIGPPQHGQQTRKWDLLQPLVWLEASQQSGMCLSHFGGRKPAGRNGNQPQVCADWPPSLPMWGRWPRRGPRVGLKRGAPAGAPKWDIRADCLAPIETIGRRKSSSTSWAAAEM